MGGHTDGDPAGGDPGLPRSLQSALHPRSLRARGKVKGGLREYRRQARQRQGLVSCFFSHRLLRDPIHPSLSHFKSPFRSIPFPIYLFLSSPLFLSPCSAKMRLTKANSRSSKLLSEFYSLIRFSLLSLFRFLSLYTSFSLFLILSCPFFLSIPHSLLLFLSLKSRGG